MYRFNVAVLVLVPVAMFAATGPVDAQTGIDRYSMERESTREELNRLLDHYERIARSDTLKSGARAEARSRAERIRARLRNGDFHVGDRIALVVENEPALTDTFTVRSGLRLMLPAVGDVSVGGVLRSELTDHLRAELGRYVKSPLIRAESLIRVGVLGDVGAPGYYTLRADAPVTDALMLAGGPRATANFADVRIKRDDQDVWEGDRLQQVLSEGRTLDELDLRAGDRIIVPRAADLGVSGVLRVTRWALAIVPSMAILIDRFF